MGHGIPNMVGVDTAGVDEKIRELLPGYMSMGTTGMRDMTRMDMPLPENTIPMLGGKFQFGQTVMGGMANVLRVREGITSYEDPGPYDFPEGTMSLKAPEQDLERDGISVPPLPEESRRLMGGHGMKGHSMHGEDDGRHSIERGR
jgi:hypothetical protein